MPLDEEYLYRKCSSVVLKLPASIRILLMVEDLSGVKIDARSFSNICFHKTLIFVNNERFLKGSLRTFHDQV